MAKRKHVVIEMGGVTGKCLPSALEVWQRNGWTVVDDGTSQGVSEEEFSPAPLQVHEDGYDIPGNYENEE